MTEADELAQRYLALWTEYLTALLANPQAMETLKRWMAFAGQFSYPVAETGEGTNAPAAAWPPFFGPFGFPGIPAAGAGASGAQQEQIAKLTQRVDSLERRLAALEHSGKPVARGSRRRARSGAG